MQNSLAILLGCVAVVVMASIVAWVFKRNWVCMANWILSLLFFVARSSIIYNLAPLNNEAVNDNRATIEWIRGSFLWLLAYTVFWGLMVIFFDMIRPVVRKYYRVEVTPPGQKDRIIFMKEKMRRSA